MCFTSLILLKATFVSYLTVDFLQTEYQNISGAKWLRIGMNQEKYRACTHVLYTRMFLILPMIKKT